ncbi:hypothetical protein LTR62_003104 [Meristemomyces frigidus]|uniref:Uncharacterized protein n=1 Tax=Meristemomyces frigidus TaxID=1508187 RepID=A0AAN7YRZ9_9PEZI|nr:hypothetical protein LTR62_003104 [Meristemomyces frigidus]
MAESRKVIVYHYRNNNNSPVIKNGLTLMQTSKLEEILAAHPELQQTSKPIPRGVRTIDIYQRDLLSDGQKEAQVEQLPNAEQNVAGVKLTLGMMVSVLMAKAGVEMVILSRKVGAEGGA